MLDLRFTGRGFNSWPGNITYWPWASYLHMCASVTNHYNLVPAKEQLHSVAEKAIVCLASHWACVTDLVIYPSTGSWPREGTWALCLRSCKGVCLIYLYLLIVLQRGSLYTTIRSTQISGVWTPPFVFGCDLCPVIWGAIRLKNKACWKKCFAVSDQSQ